MSAQINAYSHHATSIVSNPCLQLLTQYPKPVFEKFIEKTVDFLRQSNFFSICMPLFTQLTEQRITYHASNIVPVFYVQGTGKLPECQLKRLDELSSFIFYKQFYFAPFTKNLLTDDLLTTKTHLDDFTKILATKTDIFPWSYKDDGCYARANILSSFLMLSGIAEASLSKIVMMHSAKSCKCVWNYHIAPLVTLEDKTQWVIDPSLDANQALSIDAWILLQPGHQSNLPTIHIPNIEKNHPVKKPITDRCSTLIITTQEYFTTSLKRDFLYIRVEKQEELFESMQILAQHRYLIDAQFLEDQFKPLLEPSNLDDPVSEDSNTEISYSVLTEPDQNSDEEIVKKPTTTP